MVKKTILVVEDDAIESMDIQNTLKSFGYNVPYIADDGQKAIKIISKLKPDLLLLDIFLKGDVDGIELASLIEKMDIPIVYLTAHSETQTVKRAKNTNPYAYLIKPYDPEELRNTIELALYKHRLDKKLKKSEESYKDILQNISGIIYKVIFQKKREVIFFNSMHEELTGYSEKELQMGDLSAVEPLILPEDRDMVMNIISDSIKNNEPFMVDYRIRKKDGELRYFRDRGKPAYDDKGNLAFIHGVIFDVTKSKVLAHALKDSEKLSQEVIYGSPIPSFVIDKDHQVTLWNNALEQETGIKAEDVIGTDEHWKAFYTEKRPCLADLLVDEKFDEIHQWYADKYKRSRYVKGGYEATDFFPHLGSKGKWLHFTATLLKDIRGDVFGALETLEDITRRVNAENALKRNLERFRALAESAVDGIITTDIQGRIHYLNKSILTLFGYQEDEIINQPLSILMPKRKRKDYWKTLDKFKKTGKHRLAGRTIETIGRRKDGHEFPFEMSLAMWKSGPDTYFTSIIRDITERKEAGKALKESERLYRLLAENAADMISIHALDGKYTYASPACINIFGYNSSEMVGRAAYEFIHPDDIKIVEEVHQKILDRPETSIVTYRIKHKNGHYVWVESTAQSIYDEESGEIKEIITISRDITERKNSEEKIKQALQEKDVLLREIHHRVKNNMQIISSLMNLQSGYLENPESINVLKESQNRVKSMAMVHELLYQTKNLAEIDFKRYVRSLVSYLIDSYTIKANQITVSMDIDEIYFNIDTAIPCGLIINELISNSLKHAFPSGQKGEVKIELYKLEMGYELRISDNGIGLPDNWKKITRKNLGLQLVENLTKQLNGELQVNTNQTGTSFSIRFHELSYSQRL